MIRKHFLPLLTGCLLLTACSDTTYQLYDAPRSVAEEIKSFRLVEGFTIRNVAAEPHVVMPVSMAIDEDGVTYVVQMADYPFIPDSLDGKSSIKVLIDTNSDGVYDSSVFFADKIADITSILPYKKGLLVAAAPYIFFMKDTDGDWMADQTDTLFSGFFNKNSEAQITNLTYGLDNWIYANNLGQPGQVKFHLQPDAAPLSMAGHDFRFRLDKGRFEAESGTGQFGLALNDFNHRFYTQNTWHIQTNLIAWRYLRRHKALASYRADRNISDHELEMFQLTPPPYWRKTRSERRQRQYDSLQLNQTEWADGHFTGASGGTFYGGDAFPPEYYGSIFTGEVAGNLIHRDVLTRTDNDITYTASRGSLEKDREFLASTDSWFRPASFYSGPDGNLFVIDMYRQHIETPVSIPEDLKADMDFYAGNDMGRIFLITPEDYDPSGYQPPAMSSMTGPELVALLSHPNAWWRTQAQRQMVERGDKSMVTELRDLLRTGATGHIRLRALYTLEGLDALIPEDVMAALHDKEAGVREHGIMLAEQFPGLAAHIAGLVNDPAKFVAFQAVLSTGNLPVATSIPALARALEKHPEDSLMAVAVVTSLPGISEQLLTQLSQQNYFSSAGTGKKVYLEAVAYAAGLQNQPMAALGTLSGDWSHIAGTALLKGIKASKREQHSPSMTRLLISISNNTDNETLKKQITALLPENKQ